VTLGYKADVEQALERDNCEIKILALQSLFQADQERAIGIVNEALRSPAGQCQGFQAAAVSMLGSHGGPRVVPILLDIARTNADQKLRLTAIKRLGEQHSDQVTDELIKIYDADRTKEIRGQVLRALVESRTPRGSAKVMEIARSGDDVAIRQVAIRYIGELKDSASLDELIRIYDADKTKEIRYQILRALAERDDARARTKLFEIARQGDTPELRIEAIRRLGEHGRIAIDDLLQLVADPLVAWHKPGQVKHDKISLIEQHVHGGFPDISVTEKRPWRIATVPVTSPDCLRSDVLKNVPTRPARPGEWAVELCGKMLLRLDKQPGKAL